MGEIVGYGRVSSAGQSLASQLDALGKYGCQRIYQEKRSGLDTGRPELTKALEYVREGDVFVVTRLDRLARSTVDLHNIVDRLHRKGVGFVTIEQAFDTTRPEGRLLFGILCSIAEFETALRRERQADGIAAAQQRGIAFGRPAKVSPDQIAEIRQKRAGGMLIRDIMREYGISKSSVYRFLSDDTTATS